MRVLTLPAVIVASALGGCVYVETPPHLPGVDVISPSCNCGDGVCDAACSETVTTCALDCWGKDAAAGADGVDARDGAGQ